MKELNLAATDENLAEATDFIEEQLRLCKFSEKSIMEIALTLEEIFINIAHYAYPSGQGDVTLCFEYVENTAVISFIDKGSEYNPLLKEDPDITLGVNERQIGGLGIFISKKLTDDIKYRRENEKNILTIYKNNI